MRKPRLWIIAVSLVLAWFIANATARIFVHYLAGHYIRQLEGNDPAKQADGLRKLRYMELWATPTAAEMLRHGDVRERRASLLACEHIVGACLQNFQTMSCGLPIGVWGRGAAESAFAEIGGALNDALGDLDSQVSIGAARLIMMGTEFPESYRVHAVVVLRKAMQELDPASRRSLVESMCREDRYRNSPKRGEDVVPIFIDGVKDLDPTVRLVAVRALVGTDQKQALQPLIEAMKDTDPSVRRAAERVYLGTREIPGLVSPEHRRFHPEIRAAFHADIPYFLDWWKNGDPEAGPQERERSKDRAILALYLARGPEVIPTMFEAGANGFLFELAEDPDCLEALHNHIPELTKILEDSLYSLSFYVKKGEEIPIESLLRRLGPEAQASRSRLIDRLVDELRDPDPSRRSYVATELGYFAKSSQHVLRALRSAEKADPEPRVRESARATLEFNVGH
jgi:HEAT repeats